MTDSFVPRTETPSVRSLWDQKVAEVNARGGALPKLAKHLFVAGAGTRYATISSAGKGLVLTDLVVEGAPCDFAAGNLVRVIEDTADNSFASGTTTLFSSIVIASNYVATKSGPGLTFKDINLYSKHALKFETTVRAGGAATEAVAIQALFLDEDHLVYDIGATDPDWNT